MPPVYAADSAPSRIGWELPPFYCPFNASLIHPKAEELEARAVEWIDRFGLYPDPTERAWGLATRGADFTSRIIPYGDVEPMVLFAEWNYWAFALDDWQDAQDAGPARASAAAVADEGIRLFRSLEAPGSALLPPGPFTDALADLVQRTRALLTPYQLRRFGEGVRDWVLGATWQTANTERDVMPSLNDFCAMRMSVNGTRFTLTWCETANGAELPPDVLYAEPVQALTDAAGFVVSCDNDLFSYNKEDHQEPWEQNLVNVLVRERGCTPREAVRHAVALRDQVLALVVRLGDKLARGANAPLRRYVEMLGEWIAGDVAYHALAPRYASPRNRNPLPVADASYDLVWADAPSSARTAPPPVPSIAWWWAAERA
ncbi:terpene synthase family protein [Streptomyces natalensis]|uniref:Terpene synthase n=1 Tax=Streptomyces natalensis ATCC 27448 TaxID=1240678 RepID=A0A0D7CU33_9ACTN|nr:terpene synthase family protein [Streptomyces natalensis]KIZ18902.1 hypothetical protein SNA_06525 [Streptomyces natalensis ATCC 27448]